jgi:hypothetical protein
VRSRCSIALALALLSLPLGACGSKESAPDAGAVAEAVTPLPAPAGHLGDLFIGAPATTWGKARVAIGQAALFLPQGFPGLVTTLVGMPITYAAEIDDQVPVVGAAARQGRGPLQLAIGVHVKSGERFIGQLTRGESARFDPTVDPATHVTLLTDKAAPESAKVALGVLGNYLLIGGKAADLYALGPYVVRTLGAAPAPKDDVAFELPEAALAGAVAGEVREMRSQSDGAAATILPLTSMLDNASVLLGDASHGRLTLNLDATNLHGRLTVTPKPGGAASKLVADLATGDVKPLLDLPDTTTLGLLWRESAAARAENAPKQADALARLLGEVSADDRAAISAALKGEAEARGDWQAVGVAFNGTGPTAMVRAPVTDADKMKKALKQLVDLGNLPAFKKTLAGLGFQLVADKAVVENLPAEVVRIRLARIGDDPLKKDAKAKADKAVKPSADKKKGAAEPADPGTPRAVDLLYFVDGAGLFAAAGYDPKDALRALSKAPTGSNLSGNAPMAGALSAVGGDATFVLVADALRITAMTTGSAAPATPQPLVVAAGRAAAPAELWARVDVPAAVVQQLVTEYTRRRMVAPQ